MLIGNHVHGSVHLDESGFLKSGENSVGVKRQYCGRFGKVDNCQMGVFLGYAFHSYRTLIHFLDNPESFLLMLLHYNKVLFESEVYFWSSLCFVSIFPQIFHYLPVEVITARTIKLN